MSNSKKTFTFFSNGQNLNSIKNQAKKAHKSGEHPSRSSAYNAISKGISNQSFNKALTLATESSPYTIGSNLYVPLFNLGSEYIIKINQTSLVITEEFGFDLPEGVSLGEVSYNHFEKLNSGWIIKLLADKSIHNEDLYHIEVKTTDEGVVADLWVTEVADTKNNEMMVLGSTYVMFDEFDEY